MQIRHNPDRNTMQSPALNPNLTTPLTFSYKDILVKKVVRAVASSVTSQLSILLLYIIAANFDILNPTEWLASILRTFTHLSTWIFVTIFSFIIFAQCLICAKDYVLKTQYCSTRFQQFIHIFSLHNFVLLALHIVLGGAFVWQILSLIDSSLGSLTATCEARTCLVQGTFFLIMSGFWMGLYFFLKVYISSRHLVFPVIQQNKFLQLRTNISVLFKDSMVLSIWPTFYFALFYYIWGSQLENRFMFVFTLEKTVSETSLLVYFYCWWYATLYFFSMNLMRFFFQLFLTEPVQFPLVKENIYVLTLQDALLMNTLPIIQNLACLDLFLLSQWSPIRRQLLFSLSQPGGHPHNWNYLTENILKLFTEYTELLKKSTEIVPPQPVVHEVQPWCFAPLRLEPPSSARFRNLRNMTLREHYTDAVTIETQRTVPAFENFNNKVKVTMNRFVNFLKMVLGINFFFGELPQVNIQRCLGNGQLIIWASQGISELIFASLSEDKFGIVQKDLPVIISTLVDLKMNLDKLNKVPALTRKVAALDDFNYKMKNAVIAAVRRSLFNICLNFGDYFGDFQLSKEVLQYLQVHVMLKNCS